MTRQRRRVDLKLIHEWGSDKARIFERQEGLFKYLDRIGDPSLKGFSVESAESLVDRVRKGKELTEHSLFADPEAVREAVIVPQRRFFIAATYRDVYQYLFNKRTGDGGSGEVDDYGGEDAGDVDINMDGSVSCTAAPELSTDNMELASVYEVIREGAPCHLYFDLECEYDKFDTEELPAADVPAAVALLDTRCRGAGGGVPGAEYRRHTAGPTCPLGCRRAFDSSLVVKTLVEEVDRAMQRQYGIRVREENAVVLHSAYSHKYSAHVVIHVDDAVFASNQHMGRFLAHVVQGLAADVMAAAGGAAEGAASCADVEAAASASASSSPYSNCLSTCSEEEEEEEEEEAAALSEDEEDDIPSSCGAAAVGPPPPAAAAATAGDTDGGDSGAEAAATSRAARLHAALFYHKLDDAVLLGRGVHRAMAEAAAAAAAADGTPAAAELDERTVERAARGGVVLERALAPVIDLAVYTRNRTFRVMSASKLGKKSHLRVDESCQYPYYGDYDLFLASLVANVPPSLLSDPSTRVLEFGESGKASRHSALRAVGTGVVGSGGGGGRGPGSCAVSGPSPLAALDAYVATMLRQPPYGTGVIAKWTLRGSTIVYAVGGTRYCAAAGRDHRSNGVFLTVALGSGYLRQRCHDPDCDSRGLPAVRLPDALARSLNDFLVEREGGTPPPPPETQHVPRTAPGVVPFDPATMTVPLPPVDAAPRTPAPAGRCSGGPSTAKASSVDAPRSVTPPHRPVHPPRPAFPCSDSVARPLLAHEPRLPQGAEASVAAPAAPASARVRRAGPVPFDPATMTRPLPLVEQQGTGRPPPPLPRVADAAGPPPAAACGEKPAFFDTPTVRAPYAVNASRSRVGGVSLCGNFYHRHTPSLSAADRAKPVPFVAKRFRADGGDGDGGHPVVVAAAPAEPRKTPKVRLKCGGPQQRP